VLEAVMRQALRDESILLIEATANQVNQFGGYTGMKPADFPAYVHSIADLACLSRERIILGGDHLGPLCWTGETAGCAMQKAGDLVDAFVSAGFRKIHLDASMACAGDEAPLTDEVVASRAASLCQAAESAARQRNAPLPVYVIGTEVPVPGGETGGLAQLEVTSPARARHTIETHRKVFLQAHLDEAWQRVIALVVQPGVEFNHTAVHRYDHHAASALSETVLGVPRLVYEAHSTDYQPGDSYRQLIRDHFAILKVGPQLSFALREALFALAAIERELVAAERQSRLLEECERVMQSEPGHWRQHYPATEPEGRIYRRFSFSDRIRYYWPHRDIHEAVNRMMENLDAITIPLPLVSQFFPRLYPDVCAGSVHPTSRELTINHIMAVSAVYSEACNMHGRC
jgi:D-tagatose-1,6-bisphosphate aldolase subunit GatZ/KbaZ